MMHQHFLSGQTLSRVKFCGGSSAAAEKERKSRKTKTEEKPKILLEQGFRGVPSYRVKGGRLSRGTVVGENAGSAKKKAKD